METMVATKDDLVVTKDCTGVKKDELLSGLKSSGQKLSTLANINQDRINRVLKEVRREWK